MSPAGNDQPLALPGGAVERNLYALFEKMGELPGSTFTKSDLFLRHSVRDVQNPMFHGVSYNAFVPGDIPRAVDDTRAFFRNNGIPYWFWWDDGSTGLSSELNQELLSRGFLPYEMDAPMMSLQLAQLPEELPLPDGVRLETVSTESALRAWIDTLRASFDMPAWAAESWHQATLAFGLENTPWRLYLAMLAGTPVACSMLFCGGGVAGLIAVGTRPSHRGNGLGKAVTLFPLQNAFKDGYEVGALFSTVEGVAMYEKLGFRRYGTISRYLWRD